MCFFETNQKKYRIEPKLLKKFLKLKNRFTVNMQKIITKSYDLMTSQFHFNLFQNLSVCNIDDHYRVSNPVSVLSTCRSL